MDFLDRRHLDQPAQLVYTGWEWAHYDKHVWHRYEDGSKKRDSLFLISSPDANIVTSKPLADISPQKEHPVLFRHFVSLDGSSESFLEFANKYGPLDAHDMPSRDQRPGTLAPSLENWVSQHWFLKAAVALWDMIDSRPGADLSGLVGSVKSECGPEKLSVIMFPKFTNPRDVPRDRVHAWGRSVYVLTDRKQNPLALFLAVSSNDPLFNNPRLLSRFLLEEVVNHQMGKYPTNPRLVFHNGEFKQLFEPSSLLAAMWFQFFQTITGERKIKQCPICRQWSDVTNVKSSWSKHQECANWDRVTKIRKLPLIKDLLNHGKSIEEISNQINVDIRHITRWLNEKELKAGE